MRLNKQRISSLSTNLTEKLSQRGFIDLQGNEDTVRKAVEKIITDELMLEDRLNLEVQEILRSYESELGKGDIDERKMFQMTKKKLAKDRGIIL